MLSLVFIIVLFSIILIYISLLGSKKKSQLQFVIPLIFTLISILLIIISFIVGRWNGMGLGAISISMFLASIIALFVNVLLSLRKNK